MSITTVDARRLLCPLPLLRAESAMKTLPPGGILAIQATDPGLHRDLPAWCRVHGHQLLEIQQQGQELVGLVKKGPRR
ncbi:MAG: sulfurtransferase TusA family protein [Magnetococcus sp. DMHC-6]